MWCRAWNLRISYETYLALLKYRWWLCLCAECSVAKSCPTLCHRIDCSSPGPTVHKILQARKLEWVAMPSSRRSSWPRDQTHISCDSCIAGEFFRAEPLGKLILCMHKLKIRTKLRISKTSKSLYICNK